MIMFCPSCGKKNDDDAQFCSFCGSEIIDTQPSEVTISQFIANRAQCFWQGGGKDAGQAALAGIRLHKKRVAAIAIAVVVVVGVFITGKSFLSPERIARAYFESFMERDWAAVYGQIYLPESDILTEESFIQLAEGWNPPGYMEYQVEERVAADDSLYLQYDFEYSTANSIHPSQMTVTLIRTGKKVLFFDDYQVMREGLIAENVSVVIPIGATLLLDGAPVETERTSAENAEVCHLPVLFAGRHELSFEHPVLLSKSQTVEFKSSASYNLHYDSSINMAALENESLGSVMEYVTALFDAGISNKTLADTAIPCSESEDYDPEADYRNFQADCSSRTSRRGSFHLTGATLDSANYSSETDYVYCRVNYECLSQGLNPGDRTSTFSGRVELVLAFVSGTWHLVSFSATNI